MAKADVLDILRTKQMDPLEFHFDNLWIYPMHYYLSQSDIDALHKIATSARLSSQIKKKYKMIDDIMVARGFKRFSAGTNRVIYRYYEDDRFLVKIAVDKVGMQDNPLEYKNQFFLKPFVAKTFYVSQCGTVAFSERVLPIKNILEFKEIASDVFDILVNKILGLYVVEDVGTKYFMNWGIRPGFGPVLLDYPYVYDLDGDKLFCTAINPDMGIPCNGEIDYDEGFNHLVCNQCGKIYLATDLRNKSADNKVIIKRGGSQMRIVIKKGDKVISEPVPMDDVIQKPIRRVMKNNFAVTINRPGNHVKEEKHDNAEMEQKGTTPPVVKADNPDDNEHEEKTVDKRQEFLDKYEENSSSTFIPNHDKEEVVTTPVIDAIDTHVERNSSVDNGSTDHVTAIDSTSEIPSEVRCSDNSNSETDIDSDGEIPSEVCCSDNSNSETDGTITNEDASREENVKSESDNNIKDEEETNIDNTTIINYKSLRGIPGSFDPDTPMYAGDGQTTQFKRKGANKQQRDESGRFVSSKGKSNGYKKKGYNKNRDDEE